LEIWKDYPGNYENLSVMPINIDIDWYDINHESEPTVGERRRNHKS